jgi:type 1 fimbria pilin
MTNIQTHSWAGPGPKMLRWLVWVFLFAAFMTVNESHAQKCTSSSVLVNKILPTIMPFSFSSGTRVLGSYAATVTLTGCTGYSTTTPMSLEIISTDELFNFSIGTISGNEFTNSNENILCLLNNICFDSAGVPVVSSSLSSGIKHEIKTQVNGSDSQQKECVTSLTQPSNRRGTDSEIGFSVQSRRVRVNFSNATCSKITINVAGNINQFAPFFLTNVQTIPLLFIKDPSKNFRIVLKTNTSPSQIGIIDLFSSPVTLTGQTGTCALSLSPTAINMGNFTLDQVKATAQGNAVSTKPLSITIGNCTGSTAGTNKVLQWNFAKPSLDLTQMTNMAVSGASQGLSAEILADQKFTLVAIPVDMGSNKIISGESYITSGKTSDNQTLNYTVRLVRNSETVTTGGFSSTATVTLSYQ